MRFVDCIFGVKKEFYEKLDLEDIATKLVMAGLIGAVEINKAKHTFSTYFSIDEAKISLQKIKDFILDFDIYFDVRFNPPLQ